MREIKFRAWDKEAKAMIPPEKVGIEYKTVTILEVPGEWVVHKNIHLMQFTGLTDKKGKEIYEGDKLKFAIEGYIQNSVYVIEDMVTWFIEMNNSDSYYRWDMDSIEVVGNIHERKNK